MSFEFKCPQCGNAVSVDESYRGQVVECPHCEKGIVVPNSKANGGGLRRLAKVVNIQCPHCGAKYEATQQDMHRHFLCEVCGKDFVIGETSQVQSAGTMSVTSQPNQNPNSRTPATDDNAPPESRTRKTKRTIWIATCAACMVVKRALWIAAFAVGMVVLLTAVFIRGRYSGKPNTPANVAPTIGSDTSDKPNARYETVVRMLARYDPSDEERDLHKVAEKAHGLRFYEYVCPHCGEKCNEPEGSSFPERNAETKALIKYIFICPWCHLKFHDKK